MLHRQVLTHEGSRITGQGKWVKGDLEIKMRRKKFKKTGFKNFAFCSLLIEDNSSVYQTENKDYIFRSSSIIKD